MAKVGLSAKFGVAVFKASILNSLGGPSAKVGSSANFGVLVFKASLLYYLGGPSAKVCSSDKFGVPEFKASILNPPGGRGSISQSRFVCQFWCTGIQGISALLPRGSICQDQLLQQYYILHLANISSHR